MQNASTTFLIIASLLSGIALIILCLIFFRQRNRYFEQRFSILLVLSILAVLIPSFTVFFLLENSAAPGLKRWEESVRQQWEKTKYVTSIELAWDDGGRSPKIQVTGEPFLKDLGKTLESRLHPAKKQLHGRLISSAKEQISDDKQSGVNGLVESISNDMDKNGRGPVTTIEIVPQRVFPDSPELKSLLKAIYPETPKDLSTGITADSVSIRSIHPGQERLASSGYPPAPTGYTQLPWKEGFVYVSDGFHINESHITHAERYGKDGIMATVSPEGQIKMMTMARKLSQIEVAVAVLLNDEVRGVYAPTPSITDQFLITSIPYSTERVDAIADSLSMPNKWGPGFATSLTFNPPRPDAEAFSTHWWKFIKNYALPNAIIISLTTFLVTIFAVITALGIIHSKTRESKAIIS